MVVIFMVISTIMQRVKFMVVFFYAKIYSIGNSSNLSGGIFSIDQLYFATSNDMTSTNEKLDSVNTNLATTNSLLLLQNQLLTVGLGLLFFICAVHGKNARHLW